ncbi:MAG: hypothetical protein WC718_02465 [Phycisphaerales bacterium]|jgi:preprotein translocase subunit SecA
MTVMHSGAAITAAASNVHEVPGHRLWGPLARPSNRRPPAKGFDVFGESLVGWAERRRARKLEWIRAKAILAAARQISNRSDAALDDEVIDARADVMLRRDEKGVVDRAFALGYEVIRRELGLALHPEQVLGALALAAGCCAELATGEGKTVTAILPSALEGWRGRGVHVVTVNDYLANRDAVTTGPALTRLGLTVGAIKHDHDNDARRLAYACDITYVADKELIFDHLRDRLVSPLTPRLTGLLIDTIAGGGPSWGARVVQRGLEFAIIDEADSVLIDEAVTPAIISGPSEGVAGGGEHFRMAALLAQDYREGVHYELLARQRLVRMLDPGREKLAQDASRLPPFWAGPKRREELLALALTAKEIYKRGEDYVVNEGKVEIIDRSTGRVLPGRQWQLGVHQAVEAKEALELSRDNVAMARSSYQGFFQKYRKLAGMTGTAREVADELWRWYRLPVVRIPTHKRVIRVHAPQRVFATGEEKLQAAADRVAKAHEQGQPVLVGTWSVTTSERMAALLGARGISCAVINAKREREEASIIAAAGLPSAVTVATNMAGRGTDIQLNETSKASGGLLVIVTERNDEHRVDRQLAGRAGRQGDPGRVETFVSLEDRLIQMHGWKPLVALVKRASPGWVRPLSDFLWWAAQRDASKRWAYVRDDVAKSDAWFDMALHGVTR